MTSKLKMKIASSLETVRAFILHDTDEIIRDSARCKTLMDTHLRSLETSGAAFTFNG